MGDVLLAFKLALLVLAFVTTALCRESISVTPSIFIIFILEVLCLFPGLIIGSRLLLSDDGGEEDNNAEDEAGEGEELLRWIWLLTIGGVLLLLALLLVEGIVSTEAERGVF